VDTDVINGDTYYYKVCAVNSNTGAGPLSNEAVATPNPITPPTTAMTSAQAIAAARTFCAAIGRTVSASDSGTASYPVPVQFSYVANQFYAPSWWVTFEGGNLKVEVSDTTGVIAYYDDTTTFNQVIGTPPTGSQISTTTAAQIFNTVILASHQTDTLAQEFTAYAKVSPSSTAGDAAIASAPRTSLGYPFHDQAANLVLQGETGTLLIFSLAYPTTAPTSAPSTISQSAAISTAGTVLANAGITGTTFGTATPMWVEPNQTWTLSGTSFPPAPRLAWVVAYSGTGLHIEVWVDADTGLVIGGLDGVTGGSTNVRRETPAKKIK